MRKRVLYYNHYFGNRSGSGQSSKILLDILLNIGYSVTVITTDIHNYGYRDENLNWNIVSQKRKIKLGNIKEFFISFIKYNYQFLLNGYLFFLNRNLLKKEKYDIVLVNFIGGHELFTRYPYSNNCLKLIVVRGSVNVFSVNNYGGADYSLNNIANILETYDSLIFVAKGIADEWVTLLKSANNHNIHYIPNCIDEEKINGVINKKDIKQKVGFKNSNYNIVQVGSVQEVKGQDILIKQFDNIKKLCPKAKLYFVGNYTSEWGKSLVNQSKFSSLAKDIIFLGHKSNALDYLCVADLIIHPSRGEALPRVVIEGMALGGAIIVSEIDGHKELIQHGDTGYLFDLNNPMELTHLVEVLYNDKNKAKRMGASAKNYCFENYSEKNMKNAYKKLFDHTVL